MRETLQRIISLGRLVLDPKRALEVVTCEGTVLADSCWQCRAALRDLTGLMTSMNREEIPRLLRYLVEKVALGDGGVTL